jgi:hypothetical protein
MYTYRQLGAAMVEAGPFEPQWFRINRDVSTERASAWSQ